MPYLRQRPIRLMNRDQKSRANTYRTGGKIDGEQHQPLSTGAIGQSQAACPSTAPRKVLIPAMKGCPRCRTEYVIASPALGTCTECGGEMKLLLPLRE